MLGSKVFDPLIPTDFSAFHAHEILKTFEIRSFFKTASIFLYPKTITQKRPVGTANINQ